MRCGNQQEIFGVVLSFSKRSATKLSFGGRCSQAGAWERDRVSNLTLFAAPYGLAKRDRVEIAKMTRRFVEREDAFECRFRARRRLLRDVGRTFAMQPTIAWR